MLGLAMNTAGQNLTVSHKLAGGLRINGRAPSETRAESQASAVDKPEISQGPEAKEAAAKEISARFADTLCGKHSQCRGRRSAKHQQPKQARPL